MYKITLDKSSIKYKCPSCGQKRMVKYIFNETGEYIADNVGRCDREINCSYHYPPKDYYKDTPSFNIKFNLKNFNTNKIEKKVEIDFHKEEELNHSLMEYSNNKFVTFLMSKFDKKLVMETINKYKIGTATFKNNGTIFWQIDNSKKVRSGKIMWYDNLGKRNKIITWYHSYLIKKKALEKFVLGQCLFGEHLLGDDKPIAIVESEKTACIMDVIYKKYTWMATGSLGGLTEKKLNILKRKKIILYPDLGVNGKNGSPYFIWKSKCDELEFNGFDISISNLLEENCTENEREKGLDIADYFLMNKE